MESVHRAGDRTVPCGECTQNRRQDSALWRVYTEQEIGQYLEESVHSTGEKTIPRGEYYFITRYSPRFTLLESYLVHFNRSWPFVMLHNAHTTK